MTRRDRQKPHAPISPSTRPRAGLLNTAETGSLAAFFGENDLGLAPRIAPATADMKRDTVCSGFTERRTIIPAERIGDFRKGKGEGTRT